MFSFVITEDVFVLSLEQWQCYGLSIVYIYTTELCNTCFLHVVQLS